MGKNALLDAGSMSPRQAYDKYHEATEACKEPTAIKNAIRDEFRPIVEDNGAVLVIFKDEEGKEHGFKVKESATFNKGEFEKLVMADARLGAKAARIVMELYDKAKTGSSTTFSAF